MWWSLTRWLAKEVKKYQFYFIYCLLVHDAYSNAKKCGIKSLYLVAMTLTINLKINVILYVLQRNHVIKFGENQCKIHKCTQDMVKFYWTFELITAKSIDFFLFSTVLRFGEDQMQGTYDNVWKESENNNLWSVTLIFYIQTSTPLPQKRCMILPSYGKSWLIKLLYIILIHVVKMLDFVKQ